MLLLPAMPPLCNSPIERRNQSKIHYTLCVSPVPSSTRLCWHRQPACPANHHRAWKAYPRPVLDQTSLYPIYTYFTLPLFLILLFAAPALLDCTRACMAQARDREGMSGGCGTGRSARGLASQLALSRMSSAGRLRGAHIEAGTSPCGPVESHPALPRRRTDTTAMIALDRLAAGRPLLTRRQRRAEKLPTTARGALQCLGPNLNLNVGVICPVSTPDGARRHRAPI